MEYTTLSAFLFMLHFWALFLFLVYLLLLGQDCYGLDTSGIFDTKGLFLTILFSAMGVLGQYGGLACRTWWIAAMQLLDS